ncbi:MAG: hypothetical protein V1835_01670 [Candidatus Micrarchaeota archaeon]
MPPAEPPKELKPSEKAAKFILSSAEFDSVPEHEIISLNEAFSGLSKALKDEANRTRFAQGNFPLPITTNPHLYAFLKSRGIVMRRVGSPLRWFRVPIFRGAKRDENNAKIESISNLVNNAGKSIATILACSKSEKIYSKAIEKDRENLALIIPKWKMNSKLSTKEIKQLVNLLSIKEQSAALQIFYALEVREAKLSRYRSDKASARKELKNALIRLAGKRE